MEAASRTAVETLTGEELPSRTSQKSAAQKGSGKPPIMGRHEVKIAVASSLGQCQGAVK